MIRKAVGAIVYKEDKFLVVYKMKINTNKGKQDINGEWDFIKGGVEKGEKNLNFTLMRELNEETGSNEFRIEKVFDEKIYFEFPDEIKEKTGYKNQETTMFLVKFLGDCDSLTPQDDEIRELKFIEKEKVLETLTHQDTKEYFVKHINQ